MYLKIEVSAITGFFSEILEHSHLTFLAQLHDKISSLSQTESNLDSIFALFIPFYICVLCYSSAVQLRGPLHQKKKNTLAASFDQTLALKTPPLIVGLLKIHLWSLKKVTPIFSAAYKQELHKQITYVFKILQNSCDREILPSRLDLTAWRN